MIPPLRFDRLCIVRPAVQKVHRADHIVKRIGGEDFFDRRLITEIADLNARQHLVLFLQFLNKGKIFVKRVLKFVLFQPLPLKLPHGAVVQDKIIIVELLELGEGMGVLRKADLMDAALLCRTEEPLCIVLVVRAVLEMHVIVKAHLIPQSNSPARMRSQTSITPCSRLLGAR